MSVFVFRKTIDGSSARISGGYVYVFQAGINLNSNGQCFSITYAGKRSSDEE